ncbi:hypothetical protein PpBr36_04556 [Pyricularia pennisetigena]|uniref:hypothetical protein n=1 Tax=Pyricularia pennisetigena TaxID=1578925 RepID=UPI00115381AD|nr:hypothetical protein PpBr36_04556 [Pyricularia pennisetigena]TLS27038.1 hypothetical protein PpBr36_04556 [Pyricularia pennisetigena]
MNSADMARDTHIAERQSLSTEEEPDVPLGAMVGIALGSAFVLFLILGFGLVWLGKRRAVKRRNSLQARGLVLEEDVDEERVGSPNKLRKRDMPENMLSDRSPSPIHRIPLPVLPPITSRRASFVNFFGGVSVGSKRVAGDAGGSPRRRNSSWIDEDAIHGPKVKMHKDTSGKKWIRDSWPLKTMVPTLPKLHHHTESHHSQQGEQMFVDNGAVRSLPQPPRSHGYGAQRQEGQDSPLRLKNCHEDGRHDGNHRRPSTARGRQSSTDSTLSQILAQTEMRLEQGTITGVARRNRAGASPVKRRNTSTSRSTESIGKRGLPGGDDVHDHRGQHKDDRSRTPSPTKSGKSQPSTPCHAHDSKDSVSSVMTESESMHNLAAFADADDADAMAGLPRGISSPSRSLSRQEIRAQMSSSPSSISSSLSTVYSEDESSSNDNITQITSHPSTSISDVNQITASDPFSLDNYTSKIGQKAACSPEKLRVGNARVASVGPPKLVLNRPPRLPSPSSSSPDKGGDGMPLSSISPNGSPRPKSTGSQSSKGLPLENVYVTPARHRTSIFPAPTLRKVSPVSSDKDEAATPPKPTVVITSPSTMNSRQSLFSTSMFSDSDIDCPSAGRVKVVPPPLELRIENLDRTWSPTLGFEEDDYVSIVTPSPQPSPSIPSPSHITRPTAGDFATEVRGHRGNRALSTASSIYSQYTDVVNLERAAYQYQPAQPPLPEVVRIREGSPFEEKDTVKVTKRHVEPSPLSSCMPTRSSVLLGEQAASPTGANKKFLMTSAIAELRRMNSQVSAYSNSSSQPSTVAKNGPASPTLPQLRGGGFRPSARPVGSRNYLSLGEAVASGEETEAAPQNAQSSSPPQSPPSSALTPRGCAMSIWGGCDERQSSCSPPAQPSPVEDTDDQLMQLKMPKLDFDRLSGSFRAAVSGRFLNDLGNLEKRGSGHEENDTPSRFPVGYQWNMHARSANMAAMDGVDVSPDRRSVDSLGLYDQDGFLIASPDRARMPIPGRTRGLRI